MSDPDCPECHGTNTVASADVKGLRLPCPICDTRAHVRAVAALIDTAPAPAPRSRRWDFATSADLRAFDTAVNAPALVVVMVGIPGAGKSSWLADHLPDARVCSANAFFARHGAFNVELLSEAHESCLRDHLHAMRADEPVIAIDNTNLNASEFAPYVATALAFRYRVLIVRVRADVPSCFVRNVHKVPAGAINKMARALDAWSMPPHWERDPRVTLVHVLST